MCRTLHSSFSAYANKIAAHDNLSRIGKIREESPSLGMGTSLWIALVFDGYASKTCEGELQASDQD